MKILNYIISFLVKILVIKDNPQIIKALSANLKPGIIYFSGLCRRVEISEAIRWFQQYLIFKNIKLVIFVFKYFITLNKTLTLLISQSASSRFLEYSAGDYKNSSFNSGKGKDDKLHEWLAGIIDGDGCFLLSKKGYASLEISSQLRDRRILYLIKQKYGGSVSLFASNKYLRYRLHHKAGLLNLINGVNGLLHNPTRILQLGRICKKYGIELKDSQPLTYYSGWFAGFFDTDGSIYFSAASGQIHITASQKNRFILEGLVNLYGGKIYPMVKQEAFKWTCFSKKEILSLVNDYFKVNPLRSEKFTRVTMVNRFYELRKLHAHKASPNSDLGKAWKYFMIKWDSLMSKKEL